MQRNYVIYARQQVPENVVAEFAPAVRVKGKLPGKQAVQQPQETWIDQSLPRVAIDEYASGDAMSDRRVDRRPSTMTTLSRPATPTA